eukprot:1354268-Rhodomonas_salina.1
MGRESAFCTTIRNVSTAQHIGLCSIIRHVSTAHHVAIRYASTACRIGLRSTVQYVSTAQSYLNPKPISTGHRVACA